MMLKNGIPDKDAAKRLGHSDINMTKKYQHILADMENRSAEILNSIVQPISKDVGMFQIPCILQNGCNRV